MTASAAADAVFATLAAIRTVLLADSTLSGWLAGDLKIVTAAPSSYPAPFISLAPRANDWSTATEDGQEVVVDLNIWTQPLSQTPETANGRSIMGRCRELLHTAALSMASPFHCVQCRVENEVGPYQDPDGATLHGVVTVRVLVDHT
jgi:hypothetical protein